MLELFKKIAAGPTPPTSAQLKEALSEIDEAALAAAAKAAESDVREALLAGNERGLEKAEAALVAARRNLDRGRFARDELEKRIVETEAAEARAAFEAERAEVEAEAAAVAAELKKVYPTASRQIVAVLEKLAVVEERIAKTNARLAENGFSPVPSAEERAIPTPPGNLQGIFSVLRTTELRPCLGSPGWGDIRHRNNVAGGVL